MKTASFLIHKGNLVRTLEVEVFLSFRFFYDYLRYTPMLESLTVKTAKPPALLPYVPSHLKDIILPHFKRFRFDMNCHFEKSNLAKFFSDFFWHYPTIVELELSGLKVDINLLINTKLTKLVLSCTEISNSASDEEIQNSMGNLESLELCFTEFANADAEQAFIKFLRIQNKLKHIAIIHSDENPCPEFLRFILNFPSLQHLNLTLPANVEDIFQNDSKNDSLKVLELANVKDDFVMEQITKKFPSVEKLILGFYFYIRAYCQEIGK